jgi:predicted nucleic acid-binding protein
MAADPDAIDLYLVYLEAAGTLVETPASSSRVVISDPKDAPFLMTAALGRADVLCTRDDHFHHEIVEEFCHQHGIRILDDIMLMQELRRPPTR